MITLSLLQLLEDNGFGIVDKDLFWQKLSLNKKGIYIIDIGQPQERGRRRSQRFDLYSRGTNDINGYERLMEIVDFLNENYAEICILPKANVYDGSKEYENVTILPISTPTNIGEDSQGRIIWSASGEIIY